MKSNKYLLQQTGQSYLIRDAKGVTTRIGDLPTSGQDGTDGKSVLTGSGNPGAGLGLDGEVYIDIDNFKLFTKSGGAWSAGTNFNGRSVLFGNGAPSNLNGRDLESYIDLDSFKIHTKSAGSWNAGSLFKGTDGTNGARGKTTLQGAGPPGTSTNLATPTAALTDALSDAGLVSGDLQAGDLYLDTTNHVFYKKTSVGWTLKGTTFRPQKFKGLLSSLSDSGDEGDSAIFNNLVYTRSGGAWSSTGASTKGDPGNDGLRGKITLEGSGPPGTSTNLATPTAALTSALSDASLTSGDLAAGDIYLDTTNHVFYKKTASGWASRGSTFKGTAFKGAFASSSGLAGIEGDTAIISNVIHKYTGGAWTSQSTSVKGDTGDTGPTGPGVKVYSVALGSDSSTADTALTTSFTDMYLADIMTNEGSILTATSSKGSTTSFTMSSTGRYKIEIQAAVRAVNYNTSATYNPTVTIRILNSSTSTVLLDSTVTLLTGEAVTGYAGSVLAATDSDTLSISRIFRFTSGTVIKIQAKTSTLTSSSPTKLTYLQLATDSEAVGAADTVVTFTKL